MQVTKAISGIFTDLMAFDPSKIPTAEEIEAAKNGAQATKVDSDLMDSDDDMGFE